MAEVRECDWCGRVGHSPYRTWWHIERPTDIHTIGLMGDAPKDFCQTSCLVSWGEAEMEWRHLPKATRTKRGEGNG